MVRECFLEEVVFKVDKPGRKKGKASTGRGIRRYRALKAREAHKWTANGP